MTLAERFDCGFSRLPEIPLVDLGAGSDLTRLAEALPGDVAALLDIGAATYPDLLLRWGDRRSQAWLKAQDNPFLSEIDRIAAAQGGRPGAYMLNLSYEWSCTAGVAPRQAGEAPRLLRTLDWPMPGLGRYLAVARHRSPAGAWLNLAWPGFVGCLTGLAPGRFAAAFNQPPVRRRLGWWPLDFALERLRVAFTRALPPAHLLRLVFERAVDFDQAKAMLIETPIAMPAFFTLCGAKPGEMLVIERLEKAAYLHSEGGPVAAANHWVANPAAPGQRGSESADRRALMLTALDRAAADFDWLRPPILNEMTRLACELDPAGGKLLLQGFEADGPATRVLRLEEPPAGA